MLVDEADSILIDEARTPLIISALPGEDEELEAEAYRWAAKNCRRVHRRRALRIRSQRKNGRAELWPAAARFARFRSPRPWTGCRSRRSTSTSSGRSKSAREMFLDRQYVVRDGEIVIVDEFTGRLGEGRKWRAGIHQAVEAKEGVEITFATNQAARITVQDFFLRYNAWPA